MLLEIQKVGKDFTLFFYYDYANPPFTCEKILGHEVKNCIGVKHSHQAVEPKQSDCKNIKKNSLMHKMTIIKYTNLHSGGFFFLSGLLFNNVVHFGAYTINNISFMHALYYFAAWMWRGQHPCPDCS